jgi:hypothetical protein
MVKQQTLKKFATELDRLYYNRKELFNNLLDDLKLLNNRKKEIIKGYYDNVCRIDKDIVKEKKRLK